MVRSVHGDVLEPLIVNYVTGFLAWLLVVRWHFLEIQLMREALDKYFEDDARTEMNPAPFIQGLLILCADSCFCLRHFASWGF